MLRASLVAIPLIIASGAAFAAQSNGNVALSLAALIGEQSPTLGSKEKMVLAKFLAGETNFALPAGVRQIVVKADKITCRLGDVSIVEHSCILSFGAARIREPGRAGQELLSTLQQNGVEANGAAGTIYYTVAPIECRVDAATVQSNDGGGARCDYTNGP